MDKRLLGRLFAELGLDRVVLLGVAGLGVQDTELLHGALVIGPQFMGLLEVGNRLQVNVVGHFLAGLVLPVVLDLVALLVLIGRAVVVQHADVVVAVKERGVHLNALLVRLLGQVIPFDHFSLGHLSFLGIGLSVIEASQHRVQYRVGRIGLDG